MATGAGSRSSSPDDPDDDVVLKSRAGGGGGGGPAVPLPFTVWPPPNGPTDEPAAEPTHREEVEPVRLSGAEPTRSEAGGVTASCPFPLPLSDEESSGRREEKERTWLKP